MVASGRSMLLVWLLPRGWLLFGGVVNDELKVQPGGIMTVYPSPN